MRQSFRLAVISLSAMGLWACGGAKIAPGKDAAAQALFYTSKGGNSASGAFLAPVASGVTGMVTTVSCPQGGTIGYSIDVASSTGTTTVIDIDYHGCGYDTRNSLSGTVHFGVTVDTVDPMNISMAMLMQGDVNFSGEISDFLKFDITETVSATQISETSGSVSIHLNGWIENSSGHYDYTNEDITITADGINHV